MRIAALTLAAFACACGGPTPIPALVLTPGTYTITTALDHQWCVVTGQAPATALSLRTATSQQDYDWIFRVTDQPESTFELWMHRSSIANSPIQIHGMIRGKATISTAPR